MREKLIELIAEEDMECNYTNCRKCDYFKVKHCKASMIADHLIGNGVVISNLETTTKQKWIPVSERLPKPFVRVLVFRNGEISIDYHEEDGWFAFDFNGKRATHWMPLPEPPNKEKDDGKRIEV